MSIVHFHDSIGLSPRQLIHATRVAKGQDAAVLEVFRSTGWAMSPSQVHSRMPGRVLLTSVRRAISNLTAAGALVKLDALVDGPWGRPEGLWSLPMGQAEMFGRAA